MGYLFSWASLSKSATEKWLDGSELTLLVCGLVLAFGAAGEYLEEHTRLPRWMKWSRTPKLVFVWMVALSFIGEFIGDAGVFVFSGHMQSISDEEIKQALNKGEAAFKRAETSESDSIIRLNEAKSDATAALSKLKKEIQSKGTRAELLTANKGLFIRTLKPFAGQAISVMECGRWGTVPPDQLGLEQTLLNFIGPHGGGAGWNLAGYNQYPMCAPSNAGVWIWVNRDAAQEIQNAAKALKDILTKIGIFTVLLPSIPTYSDSAYTPGSPEALAKKDAKTVFLLVQGRTN